MISVGTPLLWSFFAGFVLIALLIDFFALSRQGAHQVSMREAVIWSLIWVAVSFVVGWYFGGVDFSWGFSYYAMGSGLKGIFSVCFWDC